MGTKVKKDTNSISRGDARLQNKQQKSPNNRNHPETPTKKENQWKIGRRNNGNQKNPKNQDPKPKRKRIRKNKNITIATIDVRGAKGKIKSLESLLTTEKIHVAIITETMFKNKEAYNIKGYKWIARNRKTRMEEE